MKLLTEITLIVFLIFFGILTASAQVSPEEHAKHHPDQAAQDPSNSDTMGGGGGMGGMMGGGGMGGMMGGGDGKKGGMMGGGGMGGMMEKMGAPKPKDLYPTLMDLPDLPPTKRLEVEQQAGERMGSGVTLMNKGLDELMQAASRENYAEMQAGTERLREGLTRFESGLAAKRALVEGKAPRNVALNWFKRDMNLLPLAGANGIHSGLGFFHWFSMALLVGFAVAMIAMYFFKMRRAHALLQRIADSGPMTAAATNAQQPATTTDDPVVTEKTAVAPGKPAASAEKRTTASCCGDSEDACPSEEVGSSDPSISKGLLPIATRKLCRLRVARIYQETADVKTFRLVACHGGGVPFSYLPGQFLTLTLPTDDKPIKRSYTISSSPTQGYYCEITVKREEHGAGSRYLTDKVKEGDTLEVKAPSGKFVFTGKEADSVVLIAGGVGITPMMSITRALTDMGWHGDIFFLATCRGPEHLIFKSELERLTERHPNLHVFIALSRIEKDIKGYHRGRFTKDLFAEWLPDIGSKWVHLCGAPPMMDSVKQMLAELDVPAENIHLENFGSQQKPHIKAAEREKATAPEKAKVNKEEPEARAKVTFQRSNKSAELLPDESILEAAERLDVNIDYSCRTGSCGECIVKLLSGTVTMEEDDGLEADDKAADMILACQAKSTDNCVVDA